MFLSTKYRLDNYKIQWFQYNAVKSATTTTIDACATLMQADFHYKTIRAIWKWFDWFSSWIAYNRWLVQCHQCFTIIGKTTLRSKVYWMLFIVISCMIRFIEQSLLKPLTILCGNNENLFFLQRSDYWMKTNQPAMSAIYCKTFKF